MSKLRLLTTRKCNRTCEGCCNTTWDLASLPIIEDFTEYSEILLTGGEPMMNPDDIILTSAEIRKDNPYARIYMYTAKTTPVWNLLAMLLYVDGITLTLHTPEDEVPFMYLCTHLHNIQSTVMQHKSMRLNVFKGVSIPKWTYKYWNRVKDDMEWIVDCPLPEDEVFGRAHYA